MNPSSAMTVTASFFAAAGGPQVWAMDKEAGDGIRRLVRLLPDTQGLVVAGMSLDCIRRGRYLCPVPGCPCPEFDTVVGGAGSEVRAHFRHRYDPGRDHYGRGAWLGLAREAVRAWAEGLAPGIRCQTDQRLMPNHVADVVIRGLPGGRAVVVLLISEEITPRELRRRHVEYLGRDMTPVWLFSPSPTHAIRPPRRDTRGIDLTRAQIAAAVGGVPVRWLNPWSLEVATARPASRLRKGITELVPFVADANIGVDALTACSLGPDGLRSPSSPDVRGPGHGSPAWRGWGSAAPDGRRASEGDTVVVESAEGRRITYLIGDGAAGEGGARRVSVASPIGQGLCGARAGERIVVPAPGGDVSLLIVGISTGPTPQPEGESD
jgi:hypothetical protein